MNQLNIQLKQHTGNKMLPKLGCKEPYYTARCLIWNRVDYEIAMEIAEKITNRLEHERNR